MYVADTNNHRIQFFFDGQTNGMTITGVTNSMGANANRLTSPWPDEFVCGR